MRAPAEGSRHIRSCYNSNDGQAGYWETAGRGLRSRSERLSAEVGLESKCSQCTCYGVRRVLSASRSRQLAPLDLEPQLGGQKVCLRIDVLASERSYLITRPTVLAWNEGCTNICAVTIVVGPLSLEPHACAQRVSYARLVVPRYNTINWHGIVLYKYSIHTIVLSQRNTSVDSGAGTLVLDSL